MRSLASALCLIMTLLSGCVIPEGRKVYSGHEYPKEALATRDEAVASLGLPAWESYNSRVLLYVWQSTQKWLFVPPENRLGLRTSEVDIREQRWALLIAYDPQGMVTAHAVRRIGKDSLEEACLSWSRTQGSELLAPQR